MATCTQAYSITIESPLASFLWNIVSLSPGVGSATFSPAQGQTGNTTLAFVSMPFAGAGDAGISAEATLTWNSTATQACNMHINVTTVGVPNDPQILWFLEVSNGGTLVDESHATLGYNGSFDIPFSLPNTGGVNVVIDWTIDMLVNPNPIQNGQITLECILTAV